MDLPPSFKVDATWFGASGVMALLGRLVFRARLAQARRAPFWSWALLLDLPIAAFMAVLGRAAGEWLGVPVTSWRAVALIGIAAYLGPFWIDAAMAAALDRFKKTGAAE